MLSNSIFRIAPVAVSPPVAEQTPESRLAPQSRGFTLTLAKDTQAVKSSFSVAMDDKKAFHSHPVRSIQRSALLTGEAIKLLGRAYEVAHARQLLNTSALMLISPAPAKATLTYYDFAVLSAVYCHLLGERIDTVISLREVFRAMTQKEGDAAVLPQKQSATLLASLQKLSRSFVEADVYGVKRYFPLLLADIKEKRVSGHMTSAVCLLDVPPFLFYAMEHRMLAVASMPCYRGSLRASERMLGIAYLIESAIISRYLAIAGSRRRGEPCSIELEYHYI